MATVKFKRGLAANLPVQTFDGCFYFVIDNGKLYLDSGETRFLLNANPDWNAVSGNAMILNKPATTRVVASTIQPTGGQTGDIWLVLEDDE